MRAQVTMFMVIGLIILVSFALVLYIFSVKTVRESVQQVPEQSFKISAVNSVRQYAQQCVASVSSDALDLLGKQGGKLYRSQGSIADDPVDFIEYNGVNVSYSIVSPVGDVGPYTSSIPGYPWDGFPWIVQDNKEVEWLYGYFGLPDFPPLYDFSPGSVQEMLETYVENNLEKCFDASLFPGMTFSMKKPSVRMIIASTISQLITEEFVSFGVEWPISVTASDGFQAELREFVANHPVSFGKAYYHAKTLIDYDVSDLKFDPEKYAGYDIKIEKSIKNSDDVIIFTDKKSKLIGRPFSFYIARKNRPPALVEIDGVEKESFCIGTKFSVQGNHLIASNGQLDYALSAFDPDEDIITFDLSPQSAQLFSSSMMIRVIARDPAGLQDYQDILVHGETCN